MRKFYIYIAGPYSNGDVARNVRRAIYNANLLRQLPNPDDNFVLVPYIPHLSHFWHLLHPQEYNFWMDLGMDWLERCDCVLRLQGDSPGADKEVGLAKARMIPVFYEIGHVINWAKKETKC